MSYWLMKTEPNTFSWEDLKKSPDEITCWEGIRNYQARNFMRDKMKEGDWVFFYHSVVKPTAIVGIAKVVKESYPDYYSWDSKSSYYDPKSSPENPRWVMVDIQRVEDIEPAITLEELKGVKGLEEMVLLRKGSRLSIQPVTAKEWRTVLKLRDIKPKVNVKKKKTAKKQSPTKTKPAVKKVTAKTTVKKTTQKATKIGVKKAVAKKNAKPKKSTPKRSAKNK